MLGFVVSSIMQRTPFFSTIISHENRVSLQNLHSKRIVEQELAKKVGARAKIAKLNVDENTQTAGKYRVSGIPTLIVFKDGRPVKQFVGVQEEAVLIAAVEAALK